MGHGSKRLVYDIYGNYVEGFEDYFWNIMNYVVVPEKV
jgi:integrase